MKTSVATQFSICCMVCIALAQTGMGKVSSFTDYRDGKRYNAVEIGGKTWMAQNLNYQTPRNSWCYLNSADSCNKYGRLYDWATAMNIGPAYNQLKWDGSDENHQGVCPSGWHLPSRGEWDSLGRTVSGGKKPELDSHDRFEWHGSPAKLKSTSGWHDYHGKNCNGEDSYGFAALPGGYRFSDGYFANVGFFGVWWTATVPAGYYSGGGGLDISIAHYLEYAHESAYMYDFGFSVRCVMDDGGTLSSGKSGNGSDTKQNTRQTETAKIADKSVAMDMVFVRGGTFTMGCDEKHSDFCFDDASPSHSVTLSDYYIGKYEVTQKQWRDVTGSNPSLGYGVGDNYPVYFVSWNDVQKFLSALNAKTGKKYRLPTEAEWEYAARGGAKSKGYKYSGGNSIGEVAWYTVNSDHGPHEVGTKAPNELGIHDMSGNMREWVSDWYGSYSPNTQTNPRGPASGDHNKVGGCPPDYDTRAHRVIRDGGWVHDGIFSLVSARDAEDPDFSNFQVGFRVALSP